MYDIFIFLLTGQPYRTIFNGLCSPVIVTKPGFVHESTGRLKANNKPFKRSVLICLKVE